MRSKNCESWRKKIDKLSTKNSFFFEKKVVQGKKVSLVAQKKSSYIEFTKHESSRFCVCIRRRKKLLKMCVVQGKEQEQKEQRKPSATSAFHSIFFQELQ